MSFQTYLDDLNSSTACCRSASLLVPTTNRNTNGILRTLREWKWMCKSVLVRPWSRRKDVAASPSTDEACGKHSWYYHCLPTEEELSFLHDKYSSSSPSDPSTPPPTRRELVERHLESKSLIVPLTDDATAFILLVLFETPNQPNCRTTHRVNILLSNKEQYERAITIQKWFCSKGLTIVHNCDGNHTVSLFKEVDSFPQIPPPPPSEQQQQPSNDFTFVDLFAGVGGFRIGMEALGGTCVGSCEIDPYARETYRLNFGTEGRSDGKEFFVNDITRLEIPPNAVDVLVGGFPCQSFSTLASFPSNKSENVERERINSDEADSNSEDEILGPSKHGRQGGLLTQHKGRLFFHLLRVLRKSLPKIFIFENVKGLMHLDNGSHFRKILNLLEESGYSVTHDIVDTSWFLPQKRERVYFVGIRHDILRSKTSKTYSQTMESRKRSYLHRYRLYGNNTPAADDMDKFDMVLHNNGIRNSTGLNSPLSLPTPRLGDILESCETVLDQHPHCFLTPSQWQKVRNQGYLQVHSDGSGQLLTEDDSYAQTLVSSYRQSYLLHSQFVVPRDSVYLAEQTQRLVAEAIKKISRRGTKRGDAVADQAKFIIESRKAEDRGLPRFFTPRECCRLQGFPEDFALPFDPGNGKQRHFVSRFYRQIGNAVSPPCVAAVAHDAVSAFLVRNYEEDRVEGRLDAVFDLVLRASPNRAKVMHAMGGKMSP